MRKIYSTCLLLCCLFSPALAAEPAAPLVVVSIKPLHSLVAGVMQGVGKPLLLVKGGGSPHGYVLRPSEARALAKAQLVVWVGHELESFLQKPLLTLGKKAHQLALAAELEGDLLVKRQGGTWEGRVHK
ncbi:MAG: zinc ABC transporter substrate-binding protein, partial [Desulfuromusa sp.]|nr:zinc ABC transporter substrate-binding protein [Desulfuromusa sp.]